jgi:putative oxidoreductase
VGRAPAKGIQEGEAMRFLERFTEPIYNALRIVAGFLFLPHGAQKLFGVLGGEQVTFAADPLMFTAGVIELVAGALIMLGLFTRIAAFIASGEMAVAYFMVHVMQIGGFWPILNAGELAALYCFVFLYIAARGPGAFSLDRALFKKRM